MNTDVDGAEVAKALSTTPDAMTAELAEVLKKHKAS